MENETPGKRRAGARRLIDLARELGNVSEACRRLGADRSAYYRGLKLAERADSEGEQARRTCDPTGGLEAQVLRLSLEYPEWGCDRLAHFLTLTKTRISSPTVQKILIRNGLGRMGKRLAESRRRAHATGGAEGNQVSP